MTNQENPSRLDYGLLLMRLTLAFILIHHGGQKMFGLWGGSGLDGFAGFLESMEIPMPSVSAFLAAAAEFFGGIALLLGFWVRLAVLPAAFTLIVGAMKAHTGVSDREYPLSLAIFLLALAFTGGGSLTIKKFFAKS